MNAAHDTHNDFQTTIQMLEKGLQVQHIATFPFQACRHDDTLASVLSNKDWLSFDQIPVRRGSSIVGILEREKCSSGNGKVEKYMSPLDDSVLVAAETPLLDFITGDALYRLVLRGSKIEGIITRSDMLKLPVRLLAFSLVTHVETLLNRVIRAKGVEPTMLITYLKLDRQDAIAKSLKKLEEEKREIDPLELTYLSDKRESAKRLGIFRSYELKNLKEINELRNTIAHQVNYTESEHLVQEFIERLRLAWQWAESLPEIEREILASRSK